MSALEAIAVFEALRSKFEGEQLKAIGGVIAKQITDAYDEGRREGLEAAANLRDIFAQREPGHRGPYWDSPSEALDDYQEAIRGLITEKP